MPNSFYFWNYGDLNREQVLIFATTLSAPHCLSRVLSTLSSSLYLAASFESPAFSCDGLLLALFSWWEFAVALRSEAVFLRAQCLVRAHSARPSPCSCAN